MSTTEQKIKVERWRNRIMECRKMYEEIANWEGRQSLEVIIASYKSLEVVIASYEKMIARELRERQ